MEYLRGKDYPNMCGKCQRAIDLAHNTICIIGVDDEYANDPEGPCMYAYDNKMFCGGVTCDNRPQE